LAFCFREPKCLVARKEKKMSETERRNITSDADVDVVVLGVGTCGEDLSLRLLGAGLEVVGINAPTGRVSPPR
jgi:hypothetical protein